MKPIRTEQDYQEALKRVEQIFDARPGTPEGDELEITVTLIEKYEEKYYPVAPPDPVEAVKFYMEQKGLKNVDIADLFGGANRVSEFLNRKRNLTLNLAKKLHHQLGISAESLLA